MIAVTTPPGHAFFSTASRAELGSVISPQKSGVSARGTSVSLPA
jgi:hypothetical protein